MYAVKTRHIHRIFCGEKQKYSPQNLRRIYYIYIFAEKTDYEIYMGK